MRVFKFGGASVKDASGVKNLASIVKQHLDQPLIVVVSAMGKSTNFLEVICDHCHQKNIIDSEGVDKLKQFHLIIAKELFSNEHVYFDELDELIKSLRESLVKFSNHSFDFFYDQIVSFGELLSTRMIHHYLAGENIQNLWVEAGDIIKTDANYREGRVDWGKSEKLSDKYNIEVGEVLLTQGFIGRNDDGFITTLGREGSDYTAAILAYIFNANEVVIWKNVPGMMNADPRYFTNAKKLSEISFKEAIELSYYGATVIHPKTLQPLKEKNLPLYVKSFLKTKEEGSKIDNNEEYDHQIPSYILKENQVLISISPHDLTFVVEENLSHIFSIFSKYKVKIHLMQNSALNFSVCVDDDKRKIPNLIGVLKKDYRVLFNDKLQLLTVRHYSEELLEELTKEKEILLEQKTRITARFVYR